MRNVLHSYITKRQPSLADCAGNLVNAVNQLIQAIDADMAAPSEAGFHARDAFAGLARAHHALLEAIPDQPLAHYQAMANEAGAVQAAGGVA